MENNLLVVLSLAISKAPPYTRTTSFLSRVLTSEVPVDVIMFRSALGLT
jgi:ribosomal protein S7